MLVSLKTSLTLPCHCFRYLALTTVFKPESKSVVIVPANQLSCGLGYPLSLFIATSSLANVTRFSSAAT
tara:strand:- start:155 stop:361 length:207 start_codon:yes stop_codon:yes gene_type:complete